MELPVNHFVFPEPEDTKTKVSFEMPIENDPEEEEEKLANPLAALGAEVKKKKQEKGG